MERDERAKAKAQEESEAEFERQMRKELVGPELVGPGSLRGCYLRAFYNYFDVRVSEHPRSNFTWTVGIV